MWIRCKRGSHVQKFHHMVFSVGMDGHYGHIMTHDGFHVLCGEEQYVRLDDEDSFLEIREDKEVRFSTKCKYCHTKDEEIQ